MTSCLEDSRVNKRKVSPPRDQDAREAARDRRRFTQGLLSQQGYSVVADVRYEIRSLKQRLRTEKGGGADTEIRTQDLLFTKPLG